MLHLEPARRAATAAAVIAISLFSATAGLARTALDRELAAMLRANGFTGRVEESLPARLGRPIDINLSDLGRELFFDNFLGLHGDNSCAGCHSPANGMGDSQSIAIGVDSNLVVGPNRVGPRNQRRAPGVINNAFYPALMWNGRFNSLSGDPFDNSQGFSFPAPEGTTRFPAGHPDFPTLLTAQAHIPQTELPEMAGFTGTAGTISPAFDQFDNGVGEAVPPPDASGFRNEPIRDAVLARLNGNAAYLARFGSVFNGGVPFAPGQITFAQVGRAIAEFENSLTFTDAPLDRFARGDRNAMTVQQKRGARLFFGRLGCVSCHAVGGKSNEMFSDFKNHVLAVPQLAPVFGAGTGNVQFDGPNSNEDFGAAQVSGDPADRYAFRTSPLRNLAVQAAFMHNGAFTELEAAVRHHFHAVRSVRNYNPQAHGVDRDLHGPRGPFEPMLALLDPLVRGRRVVDDHHVQDLLAFLRDGLLDPRALPQNLCHLVPSSVPSGEPVLTFEGCPQP